MTFLIIVITSHYLLCQEIIRNKNDSKKKLYSDSIILQKELIIGSNSENEAPFFESVRSFRVDNNGNIYVLDSKACRILKFNELGDLILTIGKKGQGPGEFQLPFSLEFGRNDTLLIHDLRNQRLSYFNREDGRLIEEISTAKVYRLSRINDNSEGNFIGRMYLYGKESKKNLCLYDSELDVKRVIFEHKGKYSPKEIQFYPLRIFSRILKDDSILWANCNEYKIYISDAKGNLKKEIHKDYKPVKITKEDKNREINLRYRGRQIPPDRVIVFPGYYPPIEHLLIDNRDNIFVRTYEKDKNGNNSYDYFNSQGKFMAKFPLKITIRVIHNNHFYSLENDEEKYQRIVRYKYSLIMKK